MLKHRPFMADGRSVAGLEFALILPLMLALLGGVYDLSEAIIVYAQVSAAAQSMVASASALAVRTSGQTALYYDQIQLVESEIWADVPTLANGSKQGNPKSITMSSVFFFPISGTTCDTAGQATCSFAADFAWSVAYTGPSNTGFNHILPSNCQINQSSVGSNQYSATASLPSLYDDFPTADISGTANWSNFGDTNVPENEAGIAPLLAITIEYTYTPLFTIPLQWRGVTNFVLGQFTFHVTGYWPVRSVSTVQSTTSNGQSTGVNSTVPPLTNQFTQIYGSSPTNLVSSTGANITQGDSVCVNPNLTPPNELAFAPVPT